MSKIGESLSNGGSRIIGTYLYRLLFISIFLFSYSAQAQSAFKCKQPGGAISFQDRPCQAGASSSKIKIPPPVSELEQAPIQASRKEKSSEYKLWVMKQQSQEKESDWRRKKAEEEIREYNDKVQADNKTFRCNRARKQLDVAKSNVPVYSLDNAGNRSYVEDKDRAAIIANVEKSISSDCAR